MILKELLIHFNINEKLPEYLSNQTFNEIFLEGRITINNDNYEIVVKTRQNVIHQMFIRPNDEFPVIIMSKLPNGRLNGMKFPQSRSVGIPINEL